VTTPRDPDALAERYGRHDPGRRRLVVAASGIVGVLALGWLAWVVWFASTPEVQSGLRTFEVVDAQRATAEVTVTLGSPDVEASCLVRATAADSSVVGEQSFEITGVSGAQRVDVEVRTEREATSVEMVGCTTPDQSRPR
jgi:hypothetical protein